MRALFTSTSEFVKETSRKSRYRVAIVLIGLSCVYLMLDAFISSMLDGNQSFVPMLFTGATQERIATRGIVIVFFMVFSLFIMKVMSTRDRADHALVAEKERLNETLRNIIHGVISIDREGRIQLMNRVAEESTGHGLAEAYQRPLHEIYSPINEKTRYISQGPVGRILNGPDSCGYNDTVILTDADGREHILAESAVPVRDEDKEIIGFLLVFRDITEERQVENEMLKAQKLESIGVLAGGIAHDFNNILMAISGNISLACHRVDNENGELFQLLCDAGEATMRAKGLARQLLTFAKGGAPLKELINMGEFVQESVGFILSGSKTRGEYFIDDNLWGVEADKGQINQVLNNLIINAVQAMPEGGTIRASARNIEVDMDTSLPLNQGRYLQIKIQDNGPGIPRESVSRIFDPYFTTKKGGSGLGLASCYSIIRRHNGFISVESTEGSGTTFTIYLPAQGLATQAHAKRFKTQFYMGKGKLLLMDDDETIRAVMSRMLAEMAYEVETACDGAEALELYQKERAEGHPFDIVIMDLTIPGGMGGKEALEELKTIDPQVKAIVSSGYSNDPVMANYRDFGFEGCVSKPYELDELSKTLMTVLSA